MGLGVRVDIGRGLDMRSLFLGVVSRGMGGLGSPGSCEGKVVCG